MKVAQIALSLSALIALCSNAARADDPPKFDFGKKDEVKDVIWKASAQVGAFGSTGNAQTVTVNGALSLSRNDGVNKVSFDTLGAYSKAWTRAAGPADANGNGVIDAAERDAVNSRTQTQSAANWLAKLRYDRFFTEKNSGYVTGFVGQDYVLNKDIFAGGQIGYSRLVLKSDMQEFAAEVGYDISYTHYSNTPATLIHSARLFLGYVLTLRKDTAISASVEAFVNGNPVDIGPAGDPNTHKGFGEATRVVGKLGLTTLIYKNISFKVGGTIRFDNAPAPVAVTLPKDIAGADLAYGPGVAVLRNEKLDFIGEAAIVVTFL